MVLSALDGFYIQLLSCRLASQKLHVETIDKNGKKRFSLCKKVLTYPLLTVLADSFYMQFCLAERQDRIACSNPPKHIEPFYSKVTTSLRLSPLSQVCQTMMTHHR